MGAGIRVASIAEGLADEADELFSVDESVVVVVVESGHVVESQTLRSPWVWRVGTSVCFQDGGRGANVT